ncbi:hypothetical protein [Myceligenerans indicum]|uniref:Uncharacterized protein n=1 Tax=Myceligenerans indicum TaxID=2593663 RepID=A0ABS1LFE6_9MICO|nr:hypothetical protein [Myceligenerans indicum]MBL0884956.1 hypothetical protein [Myceligenerans indicum]
MTADQSAPARATAGRTKGILATLGIALMLIGASQDLPWKTYKLGILPPGLWHVLEHRGYNGPVGENFAAAIGRGLIWTVGFIMVSGVALAAVRRLLRDADRI